MEMYETRMQGQRDAFNWFPWKSNQSQPHEDPQAQGPVADELSVIAALFGPVEHAGTNRGYAGVHHGANKGFSVDHMSASMDHLNDHVKVKNRRRSRCTCVVSLCVCVCVCVCVDVQVDVLLVRVCVCVCVWMFKWMFY